MNYAEKEIKEYNCPNCGIKNVESVICEYCLNYFCCECIDEHRSHCPERDDF